MSSTKKKTSSSGYRKRDQLEKGNAKKILENFDEQLGEEFARNIIKGDTHHLKLISLATVISEMTGIKLDRNTKRRRKLLIKWFYDNRETIEKYMEYITFDYS